jgi:hypothetical protein
MERLGLLSDGPARVLEQARRAAVNYSEGDQMSTTMQQPQADTEVVSGQVVGVIVKGQDKWQISVQQPGSQYTRNLWTKDAGLVNQMQQSIGMHFDFLCGASIWTNQQGQPVRSLWVNGLSAPGQTPVQQQPVQQPAQQAPPQQFQQTGGVPQQQFSGQQPVAQPPMQQQPAQGLPGIAPMEKEERIMREHAMSVAAQMLPHMDPSERNFLGMVTVAEGLIRYYKLGPPPNGNQPQQQQPVPVAPQSEGAEWPTDPSDPGPSEPSW